MGCFPLLEERVGSVATQKLAGRPSPFWRVLTQAGAADARCRDVSPERRVFPGPRAVERWSGSDPAFRHRSTRKPMSPLTCTALPLSQRSATTGWRTADSLSTVEVMPVKLSGWLCCGTNPPASGGSDASERSKTRDDIDGWPRGPGIGPDGWIQTDIDTVPLPQGCHGSHASYRNRFNAWPLRPPAHCGLAKNRAVRK